MTGTAIRSSPIDCSTRVSIRPTRCATAEGYEVTGTANHPLLCLVDVGGVPTLLWKLIEEIRPDDYVAVQRTPPMEFGPADWHDTLEALLLGAFISEGFVSETRAGFANLDRDYFTMVARRL